MINAIFKIGCGENGADTAAKRLFAKRHEPTFAMRNGGKKKQSDRRCADFPFRGRAKTIFTV